MRMRRIVMFCITLLTLPAVTWAYEGFGAHTPGGYGKPIIWVTNLNNDGPGSFRNAVSQGNRTVYFKVGGVINLSSDVTLNSSFMTVDGGTAPPPGITLMHRGLIIRGMGGHDLIIRGLRIRHASNRDAIWITDKAYNIVLDHISAHGSVDGNLDITRAGTRDITVSWSIFAEPAGEEKQSLLSHATRMTLHHNIFTAAKQRNPQITWDENSSRTQDPNTTADMRNNLIWNWRGGMGTRIRYGAHVNVVNNLYAAAGGDKVDALIICKGAGSPSECYGDATNIARVYTRGNVSLDGMNLDSRGNVSSPFPAPPVDTQEARDAACRVLAGAGVRPLDSTDAWYLARINLAFCP